MIAVAALCFAVAADVHGDAAVGMIVLFGGGGLVAGLAGLLLAFWGIEAMLTRRRER